jgi:hypothetical protein
VEYADVLDHLHGRQARYVAMGGVALVAHGMAREVRDLDIIVGGPPHAIDGTILALTSIGFYPTIPLPLSAVVGRPTTGRSRFGS